MLSAGYLIVAAAGIAYILWRFEGIFTLLREHVATDDWADLGDPHSASDLFFHGNRKFGPFMKNRVYAASCPPNVVAQVDSFRSHALRILQSLALLGVLYVLALLLF
jgi:hypothetical protein